MRSAHEVRLLREEARNVTFEKDGKRYVPIILRNPNAYACYGCAFVEGEGDAQHTEA